MVAELEECLVGVIVRQDELDGWWWRTHKHVWALGGRDAKAGWPALSHRWPAKIGSAGLARFRKRSQKIHPSPTGGLVGWPVLAGQKRTGPTKSVKKIKKGIFWPTLPPFLEYNSLIFPYW